MAALKTKADLYSAEGSERVRIWKSITLSTGDTLATGLKDVWAVETQKPTNFTSWTVAAGVVTFTLVAPYTGVLKVCGR